MPSTNAKVRRSGERGFTLVELMTAALISLIVFAALFSAYIFIARNITRISFAHQQSLQSSRILHMFADDVGAATRVTGASNWQLQLQVLTKSGGTSTVNYIYTPAAQTLQRTEATSTVILTGITPLPLGFSTPSNSSNIFNYYNQLGMSLTLPAPTIYPPPNNTVVNLIDIRQIELSFLSTDGVGNNGTLVRTPSLSSRMIIRNKPPLGQ
jgi:prepilin-type N-terminal cleavage/methylation domain-containing protein